jgi:hypothetical protein
MRKRHGEEATHTPQQAQTVVVYTHRFKPQHYRAGVDFVTKRFPDAQVKLRKKRHNIFLENPSTCELLNVTFFEDGASVDEWNNAEARLATLEELQSMLDGPVKMQTYAVAGIVGVGD